MWPAEKRNKCIAFRGCRTNLYPHVWQQDVYVWLSYLINDVGFVCFLILLLLFPDNRALWGRNSRSVDLPRTLFLHTQALCTMACRRCQEQCVKDFIRIAASGFLSKFCILKGRAVTIVLTQICIMRSQMRSRTCVLRSHALTKIIYHNVT